MPKYTIDTNKIFGKIIPSRNGPVWPKLLTFLGILGVVFYAVGPIFFPEVDLRRPELLPVYTLMMGVGQLLKQPAVRLPPEQNDEEETDATSNSKSEQHIRNT